MLRLFPKRIMAKRVCLMTASTNPVMSKCVGWIVSEPCRPFDDFCRTLSVLRIFTICLRTAVRVGEEKKRQWFQVDLKTTKAIIVLNVRWIENMSERGLRVEIADCHAMTCVWKKRKEDGFGSLQHHTPQTCRVDYFPIVDEVGNTAMLPWHE